jgi:hypothetical protein
MKGITELLGTVTAIVSLYYIISNLKLIQLKAYKFFLWILRVKKKLELELYLFVFRMKKIPEYFKMYRKWWRHAGKEIRDNYYNTEY